VNYTSSGLQTGNLNTDIRVSVGDMATILEIQRRIGVRYKTQIKCDG